MLNLTDDQAVSIDLAMRRGFPQILFVWLRASYLLFILSARLGKASGHTNFLSGHFSLDGLSGRMKP